MDGVVVAHTTVQATSGIGNQRMTIDKVEFNVPIDDTRFAPPSADSYDASGRPTDWAVRRSVPHRESPDPAMLASPRHARHLRQPDHEGAGGCRSCSPSRGKAGSA